MDDAEYERVRRAAYSRDATSADLDALATLEASRPTPHHETDVVETLDDDPAPAIDAPLEPVERDASRQRRLIVFAAAVGLALIVGVIGGWFVRQAVSDPSPVSSLDVFSERPDADDATMIFSGIGDPSHALVVTDVRYLDDVNDHEVYGALGIQRQERGDATQVVCLAVVFSTQFVGTTCTPIDAFAVNGVSLGTGDGVGSTAAHYVWGPTGGPTQTELPE